MKVGDEMWVIRNDTVYSCKVLVIRPKRVCIEVGDLLIVNVGDLHATRADALEALLKQEREARRVADQLDKQAYRESRRKWQ